MAKTGKKSSTAEEIRVELSGCDQDTVADSMTAGSLLIDLPAGKFSSYLKLEDSFVDYFENLFHREVLDLNKSLHRNILVRADFLSAAELGSEGPESWELAFRLCLQHLRTRLQRSALSEAPQLPPAGVSPYAVVLTSYLDEQVRFDSLRQAGHSVAATDSHKETVQTFEGETLQFKKARVAIESASHQLYLGSEENFDPDRAITNAVSILTDETFTPIKKLASLRHRPPAELIDQKKESLSLLADFQTHSIEIAKAIDARLDEFARQYHEDFQDLLTALEGTRASSPTGAEEICRVLNATAERLQVDFYIEGVSCPVALIPSSAKSKAGDIEATFHVRPADKEAGKENTGKAFPKLAIRPRQD